MEVEYECCSSRFFIYILIIVLLVLFAMIMSALNIGLLSMKPVDLEVLANSGKPKDRKRAAKILPLFERQHLVLCTIIICNAAAMEGLPIFLDRLVPAWGAILISVTLILLVGEIIPQSVCSRHPLPIFATLTPLVRALIWVCFPVAYPISKLLDYLLGHGHAPLLRRAELKTLVDMHGDKAGRGGELTHNETTIIAGALELTEKTAGDAMTPISETFAIDINAKLDKNLMNLIMEKAYSRVPVYCEEPTNIIGVVLVKSLLAIHPDDETPVKNVTIRKIPRVPETLPLYDILTEFQKGHSHMAIVISGSKTEEQPNGHTAGNSMKEVSLDIEKILKNKRSLYKSKSFPNRNRSGARSKRWSKQIYSDILQIDGETLLNIPEEEVVVGVITMEDVMEELLQEEILDETDHQNS